MRRYRDAAPHLIAVAQAADNPLAQVEIADVLDRAGDPEAAADTYRAALASSPVKAPIHVRLSTLALVRGEREQARAALADALTADPADGYAHLSLATHFLPDADEAAIRAALVTARDRKPHLYAAPLTFALARVLERDGRTAEAFDAYVAANAIMAPLQRPTPEIEKTIAARIATFTGAFVASRTSWGSRSTQPVFVFGLPRSGTTLVEQILASHPEATGLGEIETLPPLVAGLGLEPSRDDVRRAAAAYLAGWPAAASGRTRVIDKSLSTWTLLGPALLMFPEARFVHVERHPLDTAWSTFTELFPENALSDAYDFRRLAAQAALYRRTMDAWESAFPGRIVTVRYETLVADPEREVRRLLDPVGLPFDAACLTPHETARTVRTASASQVRRPISASAVGRAQSTYGERLKPLADVLKPLIARYEASA
jgi:tetratricopeptide (TPR) repeat protein